MNYYIYIGQLLCYNIYTMQFNNSVSKVNAN